MSDKTAAEWLQQAQRYYGDGVDATRRAVQRGTMPTDVAQAAALNVSALFHGALAAAVIALATHAIDRKRSGAN